MADRFLSPAEIVDLLSEAPMRDAAIIALAGQPLTAPRKISLNRSNIMALRAGLNHPDDCVRYYSATLLKSAGVEAQPPLIA